jgi:hypothetical protein
MPLKPSSLHCMPRYPVRCIRVYVKARISQASLQVDFRLDHYRLDHSRLDHYRLDHSRLDHYRLDHSRLDHSRLD